MYPTGPSRGNVKIPLDRGWQALPKEASRVPKVCDALPKSHLAWHLCLRFMSSGWAKDDMHPSCSGESRLRGEHVHGLDGIVNRKSSPTRSKSKVHVTRVQVDLLVIVAISGLGNGAGRKLPERWMGKVANFRWLEEESSVGTLCVEGQPARHPSTQGEGGTRAGACRSSSSICRECREQVHSTVVSALYCLAPSARLVDMEIVAAIDKADARRRRRHVKSSTQQLEARLQHPTSQHLTIQNSSGRFPQFHSGKLRKRQS
jgi:hypothetical protein